MAVEKNKPELAEVSKVTCEPFEGDVGRAGEVAMFCTFIQLDKAIPLLLKIEKNTDKIPQISEDIKGMREDIQPGYAANFRQIQADVRAIKERLVMQ